MIRLQLNDECPAIALAQQDGDHIGVIFNPALFQLLPLTERVDMFNELMNELERMRGTVIDMRDLREKRQISLLVAAVEKQAGQKGGVRRGMDTNS